MSNRGEIVSLIDERRRQAETKSLDLSLAELARMYQEGELLIRPEYQRLFRWSGTKQSQFIESLLLEMPVPPIFAMESSGGVEWELIDGLQRISTYLHFVGVLVAPHRDIELGNKLTLDGCDIITELNGKTFDDLATSLQVRVKRHYLRTELVRKETSPNFRYYMFKRLNTGGEQLSEQEVRNCTIRLLGTEFNDFLLKLSQNADFNEAIGALTEIGFQTMGDVELVLRFFAFKNNFANYRHDVGPFLSDYMEQVTVRNIDFDYDGERLLFDKTFELLNKALGQDTCRRWMNKKFGGGFSAHHFEAFSLGLVRLVEDSTIGAIDAKTLKHRLLAAKKDDRLKNLTTGGGKNSPGPYRDKISFVERKLRGNE